MNKNKKLVFGILALLVGIVAISISYAAFTQNLNINGTANVEATAWSVHFANLVKEDWGDTTQEATAPTIKASRTEIGDYSVDFYTPGDSITYTFDVVNDGDYNAKISVLTKGTPTCSGSDSTSNENVCNHIHYYLAYYKGAVDDVAVNDTLRRGQTKRMTLMITYDNTIEASELPTSEVTVSNLGISIQYVQDSNAGGINGYVYTAGTTTFQIGYEIQGGETTYNNYALTGKNVFIRHTTEDSIITESYVGFIKDGEVYYLKGGDRGVAYTLNKATLTDAFGTSNCTGDIALSNIDDKKILSWLGIPRVKASVKPSIVSCSESVLHVYANDEGDVNARDDDWECGINVAGGSYCRVCEDLTA